MSPLVSHMLHFQDHPGPATNAPVLVLLHGFGGTLHAWDHMVADLQKRFRVIAFDLPGHGGSLAFPGAGPTGIAADAILAQLSRMGIDRVHLCGHSMGGAVAAVMALKSAECIETLTLIAPGGFGLEINSKPLFRFAAAQAADELRPVLEQFYGFGFDLPKAAIDGLAASRKDPAACESLMRIAKQHFGDGKQGMLPKDDLFALGMPIRVLWGTQDNITPTRQAHKLPGHVASHVFDGVGHMVHEEVPDMVIKLLLQN